MKKKMNCRFLLCIALAFISFRTMAQAVSDGVGIGTIAPDPSAVLDVYSRTKGLLIPRVPATSSVGSPVAGLLVYDEALGSFCFHNGAAWFILNEMTRAVGSTTVTHSGNVSVTGTVTATNYGLNATGNGPVPKGGIIMWSGATVPTGWALCDGGTYAGVLTPDLRERFIVGAGGDNATVAGTTGYTVGNAGGLNRVTLIEAELPSHTHGMNADGVHFHSYSAPLSDGDHPGGDSGYRRPNSSETGYTNSAGSHVHTILPTGSDQAHENRPPYYALAFIMKL